MMPSPVSGDCQALNFIGGGDSDFYRRAKAPRALSSFALERKRPQ